MQALKAKKAKLADLLPKKGDLCEVKNWTAVSLLFTDYKIISKALANRLRDMMDQVVHIDQSYCIPGRSMLSPSGKLQQPVDNL